MSKKKFGRLPNGFGAIVHLKNRKLRNPYLAKIYLGKAHLSKTRSRIVCIGFRCKQWANSQLNHKNRSQLILVQNKGIKKGEAQACLSFS